MVEVRISLEDKDSTYLLGRFAPAAIDDLSDLMHQIELEDVGVRYERREDFPVLTVDRAGNVFLQYTFERV
jgi:hypothetical protein